MLNLDCDFGQKQDCLGPVVVTDSGGTVVDSVTHVCVVRADTCPSGTGPAKDTPITFSASAAGAYAKDYTVKAGDASTCTPGGTTGKICENQTDCDSPEYDCDALVLGVSVVT